MQDIQGKVAVVTGAAGNLGRAVAAAFTEREACVALIDRDPRALKTARSELPAQADAATFAADLTEPASVAQMVAGVIARFGRIDILANIAGGFAMGPAVHETADQDWDFMLNLNARTAFNTCRAVVPHMLEAGGGKIVNVSARAATEGKARMAPYCVSKAAVVTLTQSLAAELRDNGINVNCVLPGTIDTPQNRSAMPDQDFGKWVPPSALADVIRFLASEAARCITGAAIPVYGRS
jgi:NAD(P)-dependent dehydrogenase (short-subunit alcohol dehydrogenase family)